MDHAQSRMISYAVVAVIVLAVFAFRMRGMMRSRPFRPQWVWIAPTIFLILLAALMVRQPPQGREWLWIVGSFVIGAALGWFRAKTIRLTVDPATRTVMAQASPLAMLFILAIFAVRFGLRSLLMAESSAFGIGIAVVDSLFLSMACGLFVARAVEMAIRATKLLSQAPAIAPAA
jgi:NAD/NADP transhydrogenase beta subunit